MLMTVGAGGQMGDIEMVIAQFHMAISQDASILAHPPYIVP